MKEKIKKMIEEYTELPSLPSVAYQIMRQVADDNTSAKDLAKSIEIDQGIALKVLQVANSAFYGFSKMITSLQKAIAIIGFDSITNLVLTLSIIKTFEKWNLSNDEIESFWLHSLSTAVTTKLIAEKTNIANPEVAFLAGMSHDIGKMLLKSIFNEKYKEVENLKKEKKIPIINAEYMIFNVNHAQVGAWLAKKWNFPNIFADSILFHHNPEDFHNGGKDSQYLSEIVKLADSLVKIKGIIPPEDDYISIVKNQIISKLKLNTSDIEIIINTLEKKISYYLELFDFSIDKKWKEKLLTKFDLNILIVSKDIDKRTLLKLILNSLGCNIFFVEEKNIELEKIDIIFIIDQWGLEKLSNVGEIKNKIIYYPGLIPDHKKNKEVLMSSFEIEDLIKKFLKQHKK